MSLFSIKVENGGRDLEPLAASLCELAKRLGMGVSTLVGTSSKVEDIEMRAHPKSTPQEVLAEIDPGRDITRRLP
jgi:hypothetical protein